MPVGLDAAAEGAAENLLRTVEVDVCPRCRGVFLDEGEIRTLAARSDLHRFLTKYLGLDADSQIVCPLGGGLIDGEDAGELEKPGRRGSGRVPRLHPG